MRRIVLTLVAALVTVNLVGTAEAQAKRDSLRPDGPEVARGREALKGDATVDIKIDVRKPQSGRAQKLVYQCRESSFDLRGCMHLKVCGEIVEVYRLQYVGSCGGYFVYRERSPYAWLWAFERAQPGGKPAQIYYRKPTDNRWRLFCKNARVFKRLP